MKTVFGIDIGGSGVKGAPVDIITGKILADRYKIKTPNKLTPAQMVDTVGELLDYFNWEGPVGCGFPTRLSGSKVTHSSNLHQDFIGLDIRELFQNNFPKHQFEVLNDADAAGIAEMEFGAGKNKEGLVILCTFGTGIGSAFFFNNRLLPNTELGKLEYNGKDFEKYAADSIRKLEDLDYPEWGERVNVFLQHVEYLFSPELLIIGGGSSKKLALFEDKITLETPFTAAEMLNVAGTVGAAIGCVRKQNRRNEKNLLSY